MPKPEYDAPREDLPWEMPFTVVCVTAPNVYTCTCIKFQKSVFITPMIKHHNTLEFAITQ